jgi:hypothetical protein
VRGDVPSSLPALTSTICRGSNQSNISIVTTDPGASGINRGARIGAPRGRVIEALVDDPGEDLGRRDRRDRRDT